MSFFTGKISMTRFRLTGGRTPTPLFNEEHLTKLAEHAAGRQRLMSADGVETGWVASKHILDVDFTLEKNVVNDWLFFGLRIDTHPMPADLMRAYYEIDVAALAAGNPSGRPSARQKREARESARERLEQEAKDGRFLKRKSIEVAWDRERNELYVGTTSTTQIDRLANLFKLTFGLDFEMLTAGVLAYDNADLAGTARNVDEASPSPFISGLSPDDIAWNLDEACRNWLGNEFLLWLWYHIETKDDTFELPDASPMTVMLASTLLLDCPRGQTGVDGFKHEAPTRLPEARRAIQAGKLPRKAGIVFVRHDQQFGFTLSAENLAISGATLPAPEEEDSGPKAVERVQRVRDMLEGLDLLYRAFCELRLSPKWGEEVDGMRRWLKREEKAAA